MQHHSSRVEWMGVAGSRPTMPEDRDPFHISGGLNMETSTNAKVQGMSEHDASS